MISRILALLLALMGSAGAVTQTFDITVTVGGTTTVYLSAVNTLNRVAGSTIPSGGSAVLTWDSSNAASCTGTGFSTAGAVSGSNSVSPTTSTTYTVTCGSASAPITVTVSGTLRNPAADGT